MGRLAGGTKMEKAAKKLLESTEVQMNGFTVLVPRHEIDALIKKYVGDKINQHMNG